MGGDQSILVERVERVAVKEERCFPGNSQRAAHCPIGTNCFWSRLLNAMQVKVEVCEKEPPMKPQCPENNAVIELALKAIDGIAKIDRLTVNIVSNVALKEHR